MIRWRDYWAELPGGSEYLAPGLWRLYWPGLVAIIVGAIVILFGPDKPRPATPAKPTPCCPCPSEAVR